MCNFGHFWHFGALLTRCFSQNCQFCSIWTHLAHPVFDWIEYISIAIWVLRWANWCSWSSSGTPKPPKPIYFFLIIQIAIARRAVKYEVWTNEDPEGANAVRTGRSPNVFLRSKNYNVFLSLCGRRPSRVEQKAELAPCRLFVYSFKLPQECLWISLRWPEWRHSVPSLACYCLSQPASNGGGSAWRLTRMTSFCLGILHDIIPIPPA